MMLVFVLILALFLGHFVKGITGFGSALIAIPILSFVFDPASAIAIALFCDVWIGAYLSWTVRDRILWLVVAGMLFGAVMGQYIGISLLHRLDPDTVRICMAALIAVFAIRILTGVVKDQALKKKWPYVMGVVSGFGAGVMGGLVGSSGPPAVFFTTSYYDKEQGRSILIAFFFFSAMTLLYGMFQKQMIGRDIVAYGSLGMVVALLAARLGAYVMPYVSQAYFLRGVAVLLVLCSATMLLVVYN